jgi:hypothetical protein
MSLPVLEQKGLSSDSSQIFVGGGGRRAHHAHEDSYLLANTVDS